MQEVVDRQDGPNPSEPRIFGAGRPKERRDQGRMPIVRVDDVGPEVRGRDEAEHRLAEESEPLPVVVIFVDLRTVVQVRLVDQVDRDLSDPSDLKSGFVSPVAQPDRESCDLLVGALNRPIPWQDDPHVVAEGFQGLRQTAGHIAQTAHLGEGIRLGRREENLHRNLGVDRRPLLKPASGAPFSAAPTWEKRSIRSRTSFREGFFPRRPCRGQCRPLRLVTSSSCFTPIYRGSSAMVVGRTGKRGSTRQRPSAISRSSGSLIGSRRKAAKDRSRFGLRRSPPRCLPRRGSATDSWPTWRSGRTERRRISGSSTRREVTGPGGRARGWLRPGLEELLGRDGIGFFFVDSHLVAGGAPIGTYEDRFKERRLDAARDGTGLSPNEPYALSASGQRKVAILARDPRSGVQVWSADYGYPGDGAYLEFHRKHGMDGLRYWRVTDRQLPLREKVPYDPDAAKERAAAHADHFASLVLETLHEHQEATGRTGVVVAPFDTELFGHWWFEGPTWLEAVLRKLEGHVDAVTASDFLAAHPPRSTIQIPEES